MKFWRFGWRKRKPQPVINIHVAGSVVSEKDLVDLVYAGLIKANRRNNGPMLS